ncbi:MAG: hypothetical protein ACIALR_06515 [Blastopirellula sp. JB062]
MEFRRNAARDDRRRRAILDDRNVSGRDSDAQEGEDASGGKRARRYSSQALLERRVRIVDLIPLTWTSVLAYYALGVVLISALAALHYYLADKASFADLTSVNSLGGWLAVISLWTSAQAALVIYRIRRHRLDDYRGRYHVWLWAVALLGFAGIDLLADFRTPIGAAIEQATGRQFADLEHGWALLVAAIFYGFAMMRILWEVRASRGTLAVAILSIASLATFVASKANLILWPEHIDAQLATCAIYLGGMWLLSMMLLQYARFVWMDAIGLIASRSVETHAAVTTDQEAQTTVKKTRRRPTIVKKQDQAEAEEPESEKGWFSWSGNKSTAEPSAEDEKPAPVKRAAKPKVKPAAKSEETETADEPKRGWFGFVGKKRPDSELTAPDSKVAAQAATTKAKADKETAEKPDEPAKRGWFSWGRKEKTEENIAPPKKQPAKPAAKKPTAAPPKEEAEPEKKRGWFGIGGKAKAEQKTPPEPKPAAAPLASNARRAVIKQQQAETAAPAETLKMEPLTLGGNGNSNDDEIAALEAKPEHMLTKAERRRLKKLKRRGAA